MASIVGSSVSFKPSLITPSYSNNNCGPRSSVSFWKTSAPRMPVLRFVCAAAKEQIVEDVIDVVKSQLALKDNVAITGETSFLELGADSLDTVEIVMQLEEKFDISVEEENAASIKTIHDAAEVIEDLRNKKAAQ